MVVAWEHEGQCEEDGYGWEHEDHSEKEGCNLRRRPTLLKFCCSLKTWRPMQNGRYLQLENMKTNAKKRRGATWK
jgi:hypothetical protein